MKKIFKYKLDFTPNSTCAISMQRGAVVLCVQEKDGSVFVWAEVDPSAELENRYFFVCGTGHTISDIGVYVGTVQVGVYVWHIYIEYK